MPRPLVLASASPFRRALIERLGVPFSVSRPEVDETRMPGESAEALVRRLAGAKARTVAARQPEALVIGSDQVAVLGERILGKPGDRERAIEQLRESAGRRVDFLTGLCLVDGITGRMEVDVVPFTVVFRPLTLAQIEAYVDRDRPFNSAGSFKSEGLGIALFERMEGTDPTALVVLPLIRLVSMLKDAGFDVLVQAD